MSATGDRRRFLISPGVPRFRLVAARHVSAFAVWNRRLGARRHSLGSIASMMLGKDGGRRCRLVQPAMGIPRIKRCRRLPGMAC